MKRAWLQPRQLELAQPFADRAFAHGHREAPGNLLAQIDAAPTHDLMLSRSGPATTSSRSSLICASVSFGAGPGLGRDTRPTTPSRCSGAPSRAGSVDPCPPPALLAAARRRPSPSRSPATAGFARCPGSVPPAPEVLPACGWYVQSSRPRSSAPPSRRIAARRRANSYFAPLEKTSRVEARGGRYKRPIFVLPMQPSAIGRVNRLIWKHLTYTKPTLNRRPNLNLDPHLTVTEAIKIGG